MDPEQCNIGSVLIEDDVMWHVVALALELPTTISFGAGQRTVTIADCGK
jgi:hypothetical protein